MLPFQCTFANTLRGFQALSAILIVEICAQPCRLIYIIFGRNKRTILTAFARIKSNSFSIQLNWCSPEPDSREIF